MSWWLAVFFFYQAPPTMDLPNVSSNPYTSAEDLAQGRKLYQGRCAGCHGLEGDGGKGANLAVAQLPRATTDPALYRVTRYGLPETEMPATLLAPKEVWQIVAHVRSLGAAASAGAAAGNAARGRQLAASDKAGCLGCHAVGLEGGRLGPSLTDIGARRGPRHLRAKLNDAASDIPDTWRMVDLTTRAGKKISGVRLNEDPYSIQLRDFTSGIHSFWKQDLRALKVERRTPMPSYQGKLTPAEIDDIVAYLSTLRGGSQQ